MKKIKYLIVLMLICFVTLTGCSFGKKESAKDMLEKALIKFDGIESATFKGYAEGELAKVIDTSIIIKVSKVKEDYNMYFNFEMKSSLLEEEFKIEGYLLTLTNPELYFETEDNKWVYINLKDDDIENATKIDPKDITIDVDEKEIKKFVKKLKSVKKGDTKKGVTELIITIDKDEIADSGYEFEKDLELSIFVDKDYNITKVEMDGSLFSKEISDMKIVVEILDINKTKVSVPKDIKDNAEEMSADDFAAFIMELLGLGDISNPDPDPEPTPEPEPNPEPTPTPGDQILYCTSTTEEGYSEEVEVKYNNGSLVSINLKMVFTNEEEAQSYYDLLKSFVQDELDITIKGKTLYISGDTLEEEYDGTSIEDLKKELEGEDPAVTCTIK